MGIKHLRIIKEVFEKYPAIEFTPTYFNAEYNIDYNQVLMSLQYLWEDQKIILTKKGRYRWKNDTKKNNTEKLHME